MSDDCRNFQPSPPKPRETRVYIPKEERRMTEIRITKKHREFPYVCNFPDEALGGEQYERCGKSAVEWITDCDEVILIACKECGSRLKNAIQRTKCDRKNSIKITGGYDDEPKSKLTEIRQRYKDGSLRSTAVMDILDYLVEKEQSDDSS